jgi:pyruvate dehydrogenase E2 component (dihydrolipoamide acetyltransferase)
VRNGNLTVATQLTATLSCDHRVIDGAASAEFLSTVKRLLEDPESLLG